MNAMPLNGRGSCMRDRFSEVRRQVRENGV